MNPTTSNPRPLPLARGLVGRLHPAVGSTAVAPIADPRIHGRDALYRLAGPFALAILEPARRVALLAIDRIGIEQL